MLRAKVAKEEDYLESLNLKRREMYEEDRKKRIFDPRMRTIGLDIPTLDRQCLERQQKRQHLADYNYRQDEQWKLINAVSYGEQLRQEKYAQAARDALIEYRCNHQKFEDRREFDLNDPMIVKNAKPLRWGDSDITLGISSMQIFEGEDMNGDERRRIQRKQLNAWLAQLVKERKAAEENYMI